MTSTRTLVGIGALIGIALNVAPALSPVPTGLARDARPADAVVYAATDPTAALAQHVAVAELTDGRTCDEPATLTAQGVIPTAVVIAPVDGAPLTLVDLGTALDAAQSGTAYVVTACH